MVVDKTFDVAVIVAAAVLVGLVAFYDDPASFALLKPKLPGTANSSVPPRLEAASRLVPALD